MIVAAWTIFLISYFVFAVGRLPRTNIDRPAMAVIGATAMFAFGVLDAQHALGAIDHATIILLFAMMVLVAALHQGRFFEALVAGVVRKLEPAHLLPGVIFLSGILSALFINDVVCLFLTPLVIDVCRRWRLDPLRYLLALATASNIGSTATIVGNPQNILIGSVSHIGYRDFLFHLGPVAVAGLFLDWMVLRVLPLRTADERPMLARRESVQGPQSDGFEIFPVIVTVVVVAAFLTGFAPALVAACAAAAVFIVSRHRASELLGDVDWGLLVFFVGLFLVVGGAEQSGISAQLLGFASRWDLHRPIIYTAVTVALSNLVSNVPAVMLLKQTVANAPVEAAHRLWLLLAMASTLAGNLTITGSVANIIVVERAAATERGTRIGFLDYVRAGLPVTLLTVVFGWAWLTFVRY